MTYEERRNEAMQDILAAKELARLADVEAAEKAVFVEELLANARQDPDFGQNEDAMAELLAAQKLARQAEIDALEKAAVVGKLEREFRQEEENKAFAESHAEFMDRYGRELDEKSAAAAKAAYDAVTYTMEEDETDYTAAAGKPNIIGNDLGNQIDGPLLRYASGGAGNDVITAAHGSKIVGDSGNDLLIGGTGETRMEGGEGDDMIVATSGRNFVLAGSGSDTVVVEKGAGEVILSDFDPAYDKLDLTALGIGSIDDLYAKAVVTDGVGSYDVTIINVDGVEINFQNTKTLDGFGNFLVPFEMGDRADDDGTGEENTAEEAAEDGTTVEDDEMNDESEGEDGENLEEAAHSTLVVTPDSGDLVIDRFDPSKDKIDLSALDISSLDDFYSKVTFDEGRAPASVTIEGITLTFLNETSFEHYPTDVLILGDTESEDDLAGEEDAADEDAVEEDDFADGDMNDLDENEGDNSETGEARTFVASPDGGDMAISDFDPSRDTLDIAAFGIGSADEFYERVSFEEGGFLASITLDDVTIAFEGFSTFEAFSIDNVAFADMTEEDESGGETVIVLPDHGDQVLEGFDPTIDTLDVSAFGITSADEFYERVTFEETETASSITLDGVTISFSGHESFAEFSLDNLAFADPDVSVDPTEDSCPVYEVDTTLVDADDTLEEETDMGAEDMACDAGMIAYDPMPIEEMAA